jgi:hypothetical protein
VVAAAALTAEDRDKAALNDVAEKALEAAGPNAADIGTALHGFSERIDRGEPLGFVPPEYRADLERYREVVEAHLTWRHREERMVCDALEVAGTPDGIAYCNEPDPDGVVDPLRIVDLKTGNVETTAGKFSCQLGIYAHSALYDPATGKRTWLADLDTRWGLVLHMPAGVGTAELRWLNLEHGWLGAQLAGPVRKWRTVNHADLMRPLLPPEPRQVAEGKCRGTKRDGAPCTFAAKVDGLCTRHQGQDPDAVVPVRVQQVAAELAAALENVPEPLRIGQPATAEDAMREMGLHRVGTLLPEPLRIGQPATVDLVDLPLAEMAERLEQMAEAVQPSTAVDEAVDVVTFDAMPGMSQPTTLTREVPRELNGNPRPHSSMSTPDDAADADQRAELALMDQVRACRTSGELAMLYEATGQAWTPAVKAYASRHRQLLPELGQQERARAALLAAIKCADSRAELGQLFTDQRNAELITEDHKAAAKARAAELPPF